MLSRAVKAGYTSSRSLRCVFVYVPVPNINPHRLKFPGVLREIKLFLSRAWWSHKLCDVATDAIRVTTRRWYNSNIIPSSTGFSQVRARGSLRCNSLSFE